MNNKIAWFASFIAGVAVGVVISNRYLKEYYNQQINNEAESIRKKYAENKHEWKTSDDKKVESYADPKKYSEIISSTLEYTTEKPSEKEEFKPRVIPPEEFGTIEEYDKLTFTYFADGVLADDSNNAMNENDIAESVGKDAINHFGEYEPDSVHVCNDRLKVYYEILIDHDTYSDFLEGHPELISRFEGEM